MKSTAAIFEAIGRARAATENLASIPARIESDAAIGAVVMSVEQRERLARARRDLAAKTLALCTLLHEIADTQPTGETHGSDAVTRSAQ